MSSKTAPGVKRGPVSRNPRGPGKGPSAYSSSSVAALSQTSSKATSTAASSLSSSSSGPAYGSSSLSSAGDQVGAAAMTSQDMGGSTTSSDIARLTGPLVLTPVSQISPGPRRLSRPGPMRPEDNPSTYDPVNYNVDGTLKTMHTLPAFDKSYAEARKARYCRPREPNERDTELTIQQIFDKK